MELTRNTQVPNLENSWFRYAPSEITKNSQKYRSGVRSILMPPTFHIAHLNCHTCKISGAKLKLIWCQGFGAQSLPKSGNPNWCHQKRPFWVFFWRTNFPGQTVNFCLMHVPISWKLLFWRFTWYIWGPSTCILWPGRFLLHILGRKWHL